MTAKGSRRKTALAVAIIGLVALIGYTFLLESGNFGTFIPRSPLSNFSAPSITRTRLLSNVPNVETAIAIDPNNPNYMIVGTIPQHFAPAYSADGGLTWHNTTTQITAFWGYISPSIGDNPGAAIGPDGTDYSIEYTTLINDSSAQAFYLASSTNHGRSWVLSPNPYASAVDNSTFHASITTWTFLNGTTTKGCFTQYNTYGGDYQKIGVDTWPDSPFKGYVYIIGDFQMLWNGACVIQQGFIRSTDNGHTWDLHVVTDPAFSGSSQVEGLSIARNGEIYFSRNYGGSGTGSILFEKSADAGSTWTHKIIPVSGVVLNPDTASSLSGVYIAYIACTMPCNYAKNGSSSVFLISSTDDGNTWSLPVRISDQGAVPYWSYIANPDPIGNQEDCSVPSIYTDCGPVHRPPTITSSQFGIVVGWTDWRNSINGTSADIYAYVSGFGGSNVRLTAFPGRLCEVKQGNCNGFGFGNDQMKVAASTNGVFFAVGLDLDNDPPSNCSVICTVTDVGVIRLEPSPIAGVPTVDLLVSASVISALVLSAVLIRRLRALRAPKRVVAGVTEDNAPSLSN